MIIGFIIAGGQSSRMGGGAKCLLDVAGKPILAHIVERFGPQVDQLVLNTNEAPSLFQGFDVAIVADKFPDQPGPLAGLLSCLDYAAHNAPAAEWVATVPSDCPFVPRDLIARLLEHAPDDTTNNAVVAASGEHLHPLAGLWRPALLGRLKRAFEDHGLRGMKQWVEDVEGRHVSFAITPFDPFFNVNRPEDLARAGAIARQL